MYDGYAWLSNNVGPRTASTRLPMLAAMTCFLVMAISTPQAFGDAAWLFAGAYLLVVLVHAASFARSTLGSSGEAIRGILPVNLAAALCLVAAAAIGDDHGWIGWVAAVAVLAGSVVLRRESEFSIRPAHFAERHQLLIIIALGETIVATGWVGGPADRGVGARSCCCHGAVAATWRGSEAPARTGPSSRPQALAIGMVAGLVLVAAGLHEVVHHPGHHLTARFAVTMAAGVGVYLLGEAMFRHRLGVGPVGLLTITALACLATVPLGTAVSGLAQLAGLAAVLLVALLARSYLEGQAEASTSDGGPRTDL